MRYARDFNGFLVEAEINKRHGNFICLLCHNLAHWRKMSINQRRPHFYHAVANEDCPLSVFGGTWNTLDDNNIELTSEIESEKFVFKRKTKPNLSKIPSELIIDSKPEEQISPIIMNIRLKSSDAAQLDSTVSLFCNMFKNQKVKFFGAIPLPTKIVSDRDRESSTKRIHRRLIRIVDPTSKLIEKLNWIIIPESVGINIRTHMRS
jgi:small subunit ribosomal protein S10